MTTDITGVQRIVRSYYGKLYAKIYENLGEMNKFWEKYNVSKLNEDEAESLNRLISASEIEAVIKKFPHTKTWTRQFHQEFYRTFK